MWGKGNPIATKWGSTKTEDLADGLHQGNNIAHFPTAVQGAAAQFDLWKQHYVGMTLHDAILKWSGGNWSQSYADFLTKHTQISMSTVVTPALLASAQGLALMKYQAQWEAGKLYPLSDAQWEQAQGMVFTLTTTAAGVAPPAQAVPQATANPNVVEFTIPAGVTIRINGKEIG
jgi:hypothetical protein